MQIVKGWVGGLIRERESTIFNHASTVCVCVYTYVCIHGCVVCEKIERAKEEQRKKGKHKSESKKKVRAE